jgi:hypothetical protein
MTNPNVERMRHAIAKVEVLLQELDPHIVVEVLVEPPSGSADCRPSTERAERPADSVTAATVTESLVTAELSDEHRAEAPTAPVAPEALASQLLAQVQTAEARADTAAEVERLLAEARRVAERLYADESRAAEKLLLEAERVAETLHSEESRAADGMLVQAQRVAAQLLTDQSRAANVLLDDAQQMALAKTR